MTTPAPPRKPTYRTFVAERPVRARRDVVWSTLVDLLAANEVGPVAHGLGREEVLSFEAPWRRAARLHLGQPGLAEHTIALRDDGAESCLLVWAFVVEPPGESASAGEVERFDGVLARLEESLRSSAEQVAVTVERG